MSVYLFHQNLRRFGGADATRTGAYSTAFGDIVTRLPGGSRIAVAGFTEVMNNNKAAAALTGDKGNGPYNLGQRLGGVVTYVVTCGATALNAGQMEFVGISVNEEDARNLIGIGRVMFRSYASDIQLIDDYLSVQDYFSNTKFQSETPANATFDFRGVVYVTLAIGGAPVAVGFLHNRFGTSDDGGTEVRAMIASQLPRVAVLLASHVNNGPVYIGGDFNVDPLKRKGPTDLYPYSRATIPAPIPPVNPPPPQQIPPHAKSGGTTWAGSLFDYWFSNIPPTAVASVPVADVTTRTLDSTSKGGGVMSDHAAVLLAIA